MKNSTIEDLCCVDTEKKSLFRQPIIIVLSIAAVVAAGLYLKWPSVVALGFAPLILSMAPCALMCTVGICGMGKTKSNAAAMKPTKDNNS